MSETTARAQCCIAGGGPAGLMLALLLARAGVSVLVLEKHGDFLRDFRGDTIHPSTLELMAELGVLEELLALPHQQFPLLRAQFGGETVTVADFSHLPTRCKFIALMPQWDFLDFLTRHARRYPTFDLRMRAEAKGLREEAGRVVGVQAETPAGPLEVRADLVVAADGRGSVLRAAAGLPVKELGAPMDVLWFRLSRRPTDTDQPLARFDAGRIFIRLNRGEHWQCGYVIAKGTLEAIRQRGLEAFRRDVAALAAFVADRVGEIRSWDDVKLLTVRVDRLLRWHRPGLLCIGDAAHAMSPVGGVGINLAIQDAVAAHNLLATPLREGRVDEALLARVQRRRELPTRVIQALQLLVQGRIIRSVLGAEARALRPPLLLRLMGRCRILGRIPARLVGLGIRPEHVR
jgi:2-polyprenyl-6-methoxyphenol hydroxylase-like FAD-dependent oxidoreductase